MQDKTPVQGGPLVYMDHPPLSISVAVRTAVEAYSKMLPRALELYRVTSRTFPTITIEQDGIQYTISTDHASLAPLICSSKFTASTTITICQYQRRPSESQKTQRPTDESKGSQTKEDFVDHIVKHVGNDSHRKYVVRWYGYMVHDDSMEPSKTSCNTFTTPIGKNWKMKKLFK